MSQYYHAYEARYKVVHAAGAEFWGHDPNDEGLVLELTNWVNKHGLVGKRVIEFACGEGASGAILSRLGCIYHGVDVSPAAVTKASETLRDCPRATVEQLDMVTQRPKGEFDAALDVMGFHMLITDPDRERYLANAFSCLKPDAPMLFFRQMFEENADDSHIATFEEWVQRTGNDYQTSRDLCFRNNGREVQIQLPYVPGRSKSMRGYIEEMQKAGFKVKLIAEMETSRQVQSSVVINVIKP